MSRLNEQLFHLYATYYGLTQSRPPSREPVAVIDRIDALVNWQLDQQCLEPGPECGTL